KRRSGRHLDWRQPATLRLDVPGAPADLEGGDAEGFERLPDAGNRRPPRQRDVIQEPVWVDHRIDYGNAGRSQHLRDRRRKLDADHDGVAPESDDAIGESAFERAGEKLSPGVQ